MTTNRDFAAEYAAFAESITRLASANEDLALVVLTMAKLASDEMASNKNFATAMGSVSRTIDVSTPPRPHSATATRKTPTPRSAAVLDPFAVFRTEGAEGLLDQLGRLDLEQLRDIIHQYGMDPDKRAMKWKTISKVRARIVERARATSTRDHAFR